VAAATEPVRAGALERRLVRAWERRGALAWLLWPVSLVMRLLVSTRRALHQRRLLRTTRLRVPVVVVGNLIVGGAGKTPTVLALVKALTTQGHRPGIVSRGYGRSGDAPLEVEPSTPVADAGDEPLLLRLRSKVPVFVGRDRAAAASRLLERYPGTTIIVSDDGLQHLALARDLQLIVFDERGIGNGWLLPAGPLREPLPRPGEILNSVATAVIYNAAAPTTTLPGTRLHTRIGGAVDLAAWWQGEAAREEALAALQGRRIVAVAGMARPQRFFDMLRRAGLTFDELPQPDHHPYQSLPWSSEASDVVVTEKDAVKLAPARCGRTRVWVVPLDSELDPALAAELLRQLPAPQPTH
jgi:tetraacyldisaccharide 4'-kinase